MINDTIRVEELQGGLRAAFINLPHFRTHAARLIIHSGSMHETDETYGSAHFLEHVTFQGTEALPSEQEQHDFAEEKGLSVNAQTGQSYTMYIADGYDLESVGFYLEQAALHPLIEDAALEKERNPIIDEINGYFSDPTLPAHIEHNRAIRGDIYARYIAGSPEDVQKLRPEDLRAYFAQHYKLGNALLILCSSEPVERQREYVQELVAEVADESTGTPPSIALPGFNPQGVSASLQRVDLPETAQTNLSINYGLAETKSATEQWKYNMMNSILSLTAHRRLRSELALCYGAGVSIGRLADLSFGQCRNWSNLSAFTSLSGDKSIEGLDALYNDVLHSPLSPALFEAMRISYKRRADHLQESAPAQVANIVAGVLTDDRREEMHMRELIDFANNVSIDALRKVHQDITDTKPLVAATSPDPSVLANVGNWARAKA